MWDGGTYTSIAVFSAALSTVLLIAPVVQLIDGSFLRQSATNLMIGTHRHDHVDHPVMVDSLGEDLTRPDAA